MIQQFGVHLLIDAYNCDQTVLDDKDALTKLLTDIPEKMGMTKICEPVVVHFGGNEAKDPGGVSGFVMIAESHISFHTFAKRGFLTADVYTCQNDLDTEKMTALFKEHFKTDAVTTHVIPRGTEYPVENIYS